MDTYMEVPVAPIVFTIKSFMWKTPKEYTESLLDILASHPF